MKFKSLGKRIATVGLAGAMMMSMALPTFAATDTTDVVADYAIHKTVTATNGGTIPAKTYKFTVTPGTKEGETTVTSPTPAAVGDDNEIDLEMAKSATTGQTASLFAISDFNDVGVGIYDYTISEQGTDNDYWDYDGTTYTVRVKVTRNSSTGALQIAGVTATSSVDNAKKDSIAFENKYTVWGNDGDDDDGDDDTAPTDGLVISKAIDGDASSSSDSFAFSVTFTKGNSDAKVKDGSTEVEYGTPVTFNLTAGGSKSFSVPAGVTYTVTETDRGDYKSTTVSINNGTATDINENVATNSTTITTAANTAHFINSYDTSPLTGIVNQYSGLLVIVAIAAAGLIVLSIRRRREA